MEDLAKEAQDTVAALEAMAAKTRSAKQAEEYKNAAIGLRRALKEIEELRSGDPTPGI